MAYLLGTSTPIIRHLCLIGNQGDPNASMLTDHEGPVIYNPWGKFYPAVMSRDGVKASADLNVQKMNVQWTPQNRTFTANTGTASPLQLARIHAYDNWPIRIWRIFMPTPGDANTLGGCAWFGGRIGQCVVARNQVQFQVNSFLDVVTQKLPPNVVESTSTLASYTAATIPTGDASIPIFKVFTGSTPGKIIADAVSPTPGKIYSGNEFVGGYVYFVSGTGATLSGVWSAVGQNGMYKDGDGNNHSEFEIDTPLPWAPTPYSGSYPSGSGDIFYVSKAAPINLADGNYFGFPFVPNPSQAV
jgi:hypothetical protein